MLKSNFKNRVAEKFYNSIKKTVSIDRFHEAKVDGRLIFNNSNIENSTDYKLAEQIKKKKLL